MGRETPRPPPGRWVDEVSRLLYVVFDLPEPPSANRWWRKWNNRMVLSPAARAYKQLVARKSGRSTPEPLFAKGPVRVSLHWTRGQKRGDLDKRIGVVLDALQGVAYTNDNQIVAIHATRADEKGKPSLRVTVEAA